MPADGSRDAPDEPGAEETSPDASDGGAADEDIAAGSAGEQAHSTLPDTPQPDTPQHDTVQPSAEQPSAEHWPDVELDPEPEDAPLAEADAAPAAEPEEPSAVGPEEAPAAEADAAPAAEPDEASAGEPGEPSADESGEVPAGDPTMELPSEATADPSPPTVVLDPTTSPEPGTRIEPPGEPVQDPAQDTAGQRPTAWWRRRRVLVAGAVVGVLGVLYGLDLLLSKDEIPRDVSVAGVRIGGLPRSEAEQTLRETIGSRLRQPARVAATEQEFTVDPQAAKIEVDWDATVERAAEQRFSPWSRVISLFATRSVEPVVRGDERAIEAELTAIADRVDRPAMEGSIRFDGTTPVPVQPEPGRRLEVGDAVPAVQRGWAHGGTIRLPIAEFPVKTTERGVRKTLEDFARPAMSGPVVLGGKGRDVTLRPESIGGTLRFEPGKAGGLRPSVDPRALAGVLGPRLSATERPSRDARMAFHGKKATVVPAANGRKVNWNATADRLLGVLGRTGDRALNIPYRSEPAKLSTEKLRALGIKEIIGEFTTEGFAYDSGLNIQRVAEEVNGAIVGPGKTFSLNGFTGPRGLEQGYVAAGVIENGEASRAVGGGISQFATTMYNAAYFAAMKDVEHKEHSYYISRYPMAREATVFQNPDGSSVIDLKFKNEERTGVAIQTIWTPSSITVRLWGTKHYKVQSITGEPHSYTGPPVITKQPGETCTPTSGSSGFRASDTKVLRDLNGKEIRRSTRTVVYNGEPQIVCPKEPEEDKPGPDQRGNSAGNPGNSGASNNPGNPGSSDGQNQGG
ncbi:MAG: vanomycin resistance protein VanB [Pseudonocardiaceae bacterium]|nr:vanomycin resistance protein VanB [Pseudonocardiaceae bacterium]